MDRLRAFSCDFRIMDPRGCWIWNFDQSAFLMLGEAGAGKSPRESKLHAPHNALERSRRALLFVRKGFVEDKDKEKTISFGQGAKRQDVEANETTFDKSFSPSGADDNKPMEWE